MPDVVAARAPGHRPLRIGLLTHSVNPRGGVVHTLELADALHARGHHVTVFAPATPGQQMFRVMRCDVELVPIEQATVGKVTNVLEMVETRRAAYVAHLAQRLRSEPFEVLHAQDGIGGNALADLCDAGAIGGFVRTVHHLDHFEEPRLMALQERAYRRASLVLCVSQLWRDHLLATEGVPSSLVHNGVDLQRYSRRRDTSDPRVAARYGLRPGAPMLLAVGGVEERKNTLRLLEAFIEFRAKTAPSAQLVIAGGASVLDHSAYARRFEALHAAAGLGDSVVLTGTVADEDMPALFRAADALLMPSLREGFGLVVLEALASGTPTVVSRIAPFTEYLPEDESVGHCCWADPMAPASIARAIARACDPAHAAALARGVPPVCERFGWATSAERHEVLYRAHLALTESPHARHAFQHSMA